MIFYDIFQLADEVRQGKNQDFFKCSYKHGLNANALKLIAIIAMTIDHFTDKFYPVLYFYNGQRGKAKWMKWLFYVYYPAHLIILGILRVLIYGNINLTI